MSPSTAPTAVLRAIFGEEGESGTRARARSSASPWRCGIAFCARLFASWAASRGSLAVVYGLPDYFLGRSTLGVVLLDQPHRRVLDSTGVGQQVGSSHIPLVLEQRPAQRHSGSKQRAKGDERCTTDERLERPAFVNHGPIILQ